MFSLLLPLAFLLALFYISFLSCLPCEIGCRVDEMHQLGNSLLLITALSTPYMDRLRNLVGSMHFWAPNSRLQIYNLGLDLKSQLEITTFANVDLIQLPPDFPTHAIENIWCKSFKALIIQHAIRQFPNRPLLFLDAGVEIRQALVDIESLILKKGIFSVRQSNTIGKRTHPHTILKLKVMKKDVANFSFYTSGLVGFSPFNKKAMALLNDWVDCSLDQSCICPTGATRWTHNFDQSVFSILLVKYNFHCEDETLTRYAPHDMAQATFYPLAQNRLYFALRRWRVPKPYTSYISKIVPYQPNLISGLIPPVERVPENWPIQNLFLFFFDLLRSSFACPMGLFIFLFVLTLVYSFNSAYSIFYCNSHWCNIINYPLKLFHISLLVLIIMYGIAKFLEEGLDR